MQLSQARKVMNQWSVQKRPFLFIFDFEMEEIKLFPLNELPEDLLFDFSGYSNFYNYRKPIFPPSLKVKPSDREQYNEAFHKVMKELKYGNSFLVNLTAKSKVECDLSLKELFFYSQAKYKMYFQDSFMFFSPEPFVKVDGENIYSFPMKGTIDASIENAEEKILNNQKEKAEHNTIVDLIRNDLSIVSTNVEVPRFRYIDKVKSAQKNLLQVSSEVRGKLKTKFRRNIGDLFTSLLPAGSISGAPKPKTLEIIKDVEGVRRGYYTGVSGIYDGQNVDSCVMIRFIEKENNILYYRSGGGITHQSNADDEYLETIQKIYVPTH